MFRSLDCRARIRHCRCCEAAALATVKNVHDVPPYEKYTNVPRMTNFRESLKIDDNYEMEPMD